MDLAHYRFIWNVIANTYGSHLLLALAGELGNRQDNQQPEPSMKYHRVKDGEWIQPVRKGYKLRCCDCGLVHKVNFRIVQGRRGKKIQFQAFRDMRATANTRRGYSGIRFKRKTA